MASKRPRSLYPKHNARALETSFVLLSRFVNNIKTTSTRVCAAASKNTLARPRQQKNCLSRTRNMVNYDQMHFAIRLENPLSGSHKKVSLYLLSNKTAPDQDRFALLLVNLMQTFLITFLRPYASRRSQSAFFAVGSRCISSLSHKSDREDVSTKDGERDIFIKIMIQPWSEHKKFLLFRRTEKRQTTNCKSLKPIYIKGMLSVGFVLRHITLRPGLSLPATCGD